MVHKRNIVVSGIGKRNALLLLLATECQQHDIRIVGCDAAAWPPARLAIEGFRIIPSACDPTFRTTYAHLLGGEDAVAYLTLIDPEIVTLGELEAAGESTGARFLHPVPATASICEDKFRFFEFLRARSIATIPTFLERPDRFPFIRKDRFGSAGSGFHVYRDEADVLGHEMGRGPEKYIYQPFCNGRHYCIDAYFSIFDGGLVDLCAKEVLVKSNGESYLLRSAGRDRFTELVKKIGASLPMRGIVNFDIYDENDELKVMEINCRIGGNYPASHAFGCNLLRPMLADLFARDSALALSRSDYRVGQLIAKYFEFSSPCDERSPGDLVV